MSLSENTKTYKLNNGVVIPAVALGTWRASKDGDAYNSVLTALKNGYKHIDTAAAYGNEEEVGRAIKDSGVAREELFIVTKLDNPRHKDVPAALDESLAKLGLEYIDLYLMHWPVPLDPTAEGVVFHENWTYLDTYKSLQKVYKETNKIKALGVSNFTIPKIEKLLADPEIDVIPVANQIELHPYLPQPKLLKLLKENNIIAEAYSPLGSNDSPLFKDPVVTGIAEKLKVEPAQVLVSWAVQRDTVVLPKSVTASRVISNLKTIELPEEDFEALNKLSETHGVVRTCNVPEWKAFDDDIQ